MSDRAAPADTPAYDLGLPIETERLTIRAAVPGDEPAVLAIFAPPAVSTYLYTEPLDDVGAAAWVADRADPVVVADVSGVNLLAVERDSGAVVGSLFVKVASAEHRQGEIGWTLNPSYAGRGFATEGGRAMLALAFGWGLHRVVARADARNVASVAVMRRLGMRCEGTLVENEWVKGEWTDEIVYALLDREWQELNDV